MSAAQPHAYEAYREGRLLAHSQTLGDLVKRLHIGSHLWSRKDDIEIWREGEVWACGDVAERMLGRSWAYGLTRDAKRRAKRKGLEFDLRPDDVLDAAERQEDRCALTGLQLQIRRSDTFRRPFAPSLDRIDSSKGYTPDNVRLVCVAMNLALNEFGEDTFRKIAEAYLEHQP